MLCDNCKKDISLFAYECPYCHVDTTRSKALSIGALAGFGGGLLTGLLGFSHDWWSFWIVLLIAFVGGGFGVRIMDKRHPKPQPGEMRNARNRDTYAQLSTLQQMRADRLIDEAEFQAKKQELLDRL